MFLEKIPSRVLKSFSFHYLRLTQLFPPFISKRCYFSSLTVINLEWLLIQGILSDWLLYVNHHRPNQTPIGLAGDARHVCKFPCRETQSILNVCEFDLPHCARRPPFHPATSLTRASACLRPVSHSDEAGQNVLSGILTPAPPPPPTSSQPLTTVIDTNEKPGQQIFFQTLLPRIMTRIPNEEAKMRSETKRWDVINERLF